MPRDQAKEPEAKRPFISVIIPTYNYARFVTNAMSSVFAQTYKNRELIIVDDGSTDNTRETIENFGDAVRYVYQNNAGPSAARNNGMRHAKGDLIAFLDADDLWHPEKLEKQVAAFEQCDDSLGLVTVIGDSIVEGMEWTTEPSVEHAVVDKVALIIHNRISTSSVLFKRTCIDRIGEFDESLRYCEDWDMWLRFSKNYKIVRVMQTMVRHALHPGSASKHIEPMLKYHMEVFDRNFPDDITGLRAKLLRRKSYSYMLYSSGTECFGEDDAKERRLLLRSVLQYPLPTYYPVRFAALLRTLIGTKRWRSLRRVFRGNAGLW